MSTMDEIKDRKKKKWKIILLAIFLILILSVIGIYISIIMTLQEGTVETVKKEEITEDTLLSQNVPIIEEEQIQEHVFNVLLVGADSRNPNAEQGRSDSMMMVSFNQLENKATIISFLRDSLVEVPGYGMTRLGHSYAYGGAGLTINTINQTYGLDVQNYITINFENVENVIDKIGGIDIPITAEEAKLYNAYGKTYIYEGVNHLNGKDALMHARNRTIGNDFGRTRRQRSVMNGIYQKIMASKDPSDILPLIEYCLTQVKTNMDVSTIYDMALKVMKADNLFIQQTSLPVKGTYTDVKYNGMSVLEIDIEANKAELEKFLY